MITLLGCPLTLRGWILSELPQPFLAPEVKQQGKWQDNPTQLGWESWVGASTGIGCGCAWGVDFKAYSESLTTYPCVSLSTCHGKRGGRSGRRERGHGQEHTGLDLELLSPEKSMSVVK